MSIIWAVVFFGLLIFFHELGHFIVSKLLNVKVLKFSLGFGPKVIGKKIGETEYLISAVPLGGYVKPLGEEPGEEIPEEDRPRSFPAQPVWKRASIVIAGPLFNIVLAYLIFLSFLIVDLPVAIPELDSMTASIESVTDDSPAKRAGLQKDDTIIAIDGRSVMDWGEMAEIFSKSPGKELLLKVRRGEEFLDFRITPEAVKAKDEKGEEIEVGRIGISKKIDATVIQRGSIFAAPFRALEAVWRWCVLTVDVVIRLLTGSVSAKQVGGPIMIVDAASKAAAVGAFTYFNFIAIISINLAILNLLPVPVLDGGHIMFFLFEAVRGKPLSEKVLLVANRVGMSLLFLLVALVFYNDIMRIVVPWLQKSMAQ